MQASKKLKSEHPADEVLAVINSGLQLTPANPANVVPGFSSMDEELGELVVVRRGDSLVWAPAPTPTPTPSTSPIRPYGSFFNLQKEQQCSFPPSSLSPQQ